MRTVAVLAALVFGLVATGVAQAAPAPGVYLDLEAQWGFRLVEPYTPFVTGAHAQLTPTPEYTGWETPNFAIVAPPGGRAELGVVLGGGAGPYVRLGTVASGWGGIHGFEADSWANVTCRAGLGRPECEIRICIDDPEPCNHYAGRMARRYVEVAPRALIGFGGAAGALGLGVEAFAGIYDEHFTSRFARLDRPETWIEHDDALEATVRGILGVMEAELFVTERARLLLSAGAGVYDGFAEATISERVADTATEPPDDYTTRTFPVAAAFAGVRAELGIGFSYALNPHVSVGLMGRVDYWSAFPGLTAPSPGNPFCMVQDNGNSICEPPRVVGEYGIGVAPIVHLTLGLSLNLRLGP